MSIKETCYFSHDANAKDDFKIMLLIEELGLEGYGIFWVLIETLREQQNYKYPLKLLSVLARKYNTTLAKLEVVVRNYHLFEIEDECFFFSRSLNRRMEVMHKAIEQRKIAGQISAAKRKKKQEEQLKQLQMNLSESNSSERPLNECSTSVQQIKENKIKEKEKKEKIKKDIKALTEKFENAGSYQEQTEITQEYNKIRNLLDTMSTLVQIRHTIDVNDKFYEEEQDYFDEKSPEFTELTTDFTKKMLNSKFRPELEKFFGKHLFNMYELEVKTFSPEIIDDLKEENKLVSKYVKLIS
ncbi:MAG: DUF4373 domain-containing protein, partial [Arcobacter sp.]|nr:DUF4373 domain-containing protein [Arcobacter sp.]